MTSITDADAIQIVVVLVFVATAVVAAVINIRGTDSP